MTTPASAFGGALIVSELANVRHLIASRWLGDTPVDAGVGEITLHSHQTDAVARMRVALNEYGGVLLADAVGLGKTYVALALARDARHPLIVTPAALRDMWADALARTGQGAELRTHEWLSRTSSDARTQDWDLVIVDEAHHARNPATRRYRALAALTTRARVVLLSATPVHNSARDLAALLALFLGARAWTLAPADLARCVVRREHTTVRTTQRIPVASEPRWLALPHRDDIVARLLTLPSPLPPSDGGNAGVLVAHALVRRWMSSDAALRSTLHRRAARATALAAALEEGRYPTSAELRAWIGSPEDGAVQLAFPTFVASPSTCDDAALLAAVREHGTAVRLLLRELGAMPSCDEERADRLREIRARHPGERVVAFTVFADTARALFQLLRREPGVGLLTAHGAQVAGGCIARADALARFAPDASRRPAPHPRDAIDVLIATDLLSEGVNLQDASVVVHLDLPWTPARLEQRVGRVARLGSRHERTAVYALAPPASAEALVHVERRLREKIRVAGRALGIAGGILPGIHHQAADTRSPSKVVEHLRDILRVWQQQPVTQELATGADVPLVAAAQSDRDGFLALLRRPDTSRVLLGAAGSAVSDAPATVLAAAERASSTAVTPSERSVASATATIALWTMRARTRGDVQLRDVASARARRALLHRVAAIARRATPDRRPALAALASQARRAATLPCGAGAERVLDELARATMPDEAWLRAVGAFEALHRRTETASDGELELEALIVFESDR